jgi:hypothetical protein
VRKTSLAVCAFPMGTTLKWMMFSSVVNKKFCGTSCITFQTHLVYFSITRSALGYGYLYYQIFSHIFEQE